MDLVELFYERLTTVVEMKKSLTSDQLKLCYDVFKSSVEIGTVNLENYSDNLFINPSTSFVFKFVPKHPLFPINIYVCVGINVDGKVLPLNINHVLVCQANGWFYDSSKLTGLSSETESYYSLCLTE